MIRYIGFIALVKAYIISFKEDKKRRALLAERFANTGLEIVFVDAVRGSALDELEKAPFRDNRRQHKSPYILKDNVVGCALSHYKAWQMLIDSGDGYGFVFEDDAMPLSDDISAALTRLSEMADQLDIVSLANRRPKLKREKIAVCSENTALYALRGNDIGAEAYFINSDAAQRLLNHRNRYEYEVDFLIHHWWMHDCQILHLMPPLFAEDGRTSSIGYAETEIWEKDSLMHKISRRVHRLIDSFQKRYRFSGYLNNIRNRVSPS